MSDKSDLTTKKNEPPAPTPPPEPPPAAPSPPAAPIAAVAERKIEPQREINFHEHGWKQTHFDAIAAVGVRPEDVLKREYWAHVAQRNLNSMSKISIIAEDRSWYGELVVFQAYSNGALVAFIFPPVRISGAGLTREESEYEVVDGGIAKRWCVKARNSDRIISDGHPTVAEAESWLANWLKALGPRRAA